MKTPGTLVIEHGVISNGSGRGYLPLLWIDGRPTGSTYSGHGYDHGEAGSVAEAMAAIEANRHVGDWHITIMARDSIEAAK